MKSLKPSITATCPECESSFVEYLRDPDTGEIVRPEDRRLFVCRICKHIFPIFPDEAPAALRDADGTQIDYDRVCPTCGYNLRSLKIGAKCPECGTRIVPAVPSPILENDDPWTGWDWAILVTFIAGVFTAWQFGRHGRLGPTIILAMLGLMVTLKGCSGFATGRISIGKSFLRRTVTGLSARIYSALHLLFGASLFLLSAALHFGWHW